MAQGKMLIIVLVTLVAGFGATSAASFTGRSSASGPVQDKHMISRRSFEMKQARVNADVLSTQRRSGGCAGQSGE